MEPIEMSLDDIIKKNQVRGKPRKGGAPTAAKRFVKPLKGPIKKNIKGIQKKTFSPPKKTIDARMKLIRNSRQKIADAREVIAEHTRSTIKDARELLSIRKKQVIPKATRPAKIPRSRSGAVLAINSEFMMDEDDDNDDLVLRDLKTFNTQPITSLRRTVKNDIYRTTSPPPLRAMPRLPTFSIQNREPSPSSIDPFDCYVVPTRRAVPPPPAPPRIERAFRSSKMSAHMDNYLKSPPLSLSHKGILRQASRGGDEHDDRFESDRYIGEGRSTGSSRYPNDSAGIFAKIADYKSPPRSKGFRIIITNLVPSVSEGDVEELFSEVGELLSAKLIKVGTAEVIFRNEGDDERAHDVYHNRLIDGQPMKITLTGPLTKASAHYRS